MRLRPPKRLWAPKAGNSQAEYEDASRVVYPHLPAPGGGVARAVVSDGASESAFARSWAAILADAFAAKPLALSSLSGPALANWLEPCQKRWREAVPWQRLPWHGETKARNGAMSALLGVSFQEKKNRRNLSWQAVAVGDCCLFVIHGNALVLSFPIGDAAQFNNTPPMICSNPANNQGLWSRVSQISGECRPGDRFILASDALAYWILREQEHGRQPWQTLMRLNPGEQWESWLHNRRAERTMRNDDATLLIIEVE